MAISDAKPGKLIDVRPFGPAFAQAKTTVLIKTDALQIVRLLVPAGKEIPRHSAPGEITVQCLEGVVAFTAEDVTHKLQAGQIIHLPSKVFHSLLGIEDASVLVTISLR